MRDQRKSRRLSCAVAPLAAGMCPVPAPGAPECDRDGGGLRRCDAKSSRLAIMSPVPRLAPMRTMICALKAARRDGSFKIQFRRWSYARFHAMTMAARNALMLVTFGGFAKEQFLGLIVSYGLFPGLSLFPDECSLMGCWPGGFLLPVSRVVFPRAIRSNSSSE